jgi:hypothetical protein
MAGRSSFLDRNADGPGEGMESPILEDWTASCIRLWKVKHVSYLCTVRAQQAQDLDIVPLRAAAMLGPRIRYYLQEFVS